MYNDLLKNMNQARIFSEYGSSSWIEFHDRQITNSLYIVDCKTMYVWCAIFSIFVFGVNIL